MTRPEQLRYQGTDEGNAIAYRFLRIRLSCSLSPSRWKGRSFSNLDHCRAGRCRPAGPRTRFGAYEIMTPPCAGGIAEVFRVRARSAIARHAGTVMRRARRLRATARCAVSSIKPQTLP